jgi:Leucine-rich repeat (LRR) protein
MHKLQPIVDTVLKTRRSKEDRMKNRIVADQRKIQQYIKDGSKGDLDLNASPITELPDNLRIVNGNLDLGDSKIERLPTGLRVDVNLYLEGSEIKELPEGLIIGKNLAIDNTQISRLPDKLTVEGALFMENTPAAIKVNRYQDELRAMLPGVKGEIYA